jgi:RimJ/RimL family protein N-acetyltransferase
MWIEPVVLDGRHVRLEPLMPEHAAALWAVSDDFEIYRYKPYHLHSEADLRLLIEKYRQVHGAGGGLTFATIDKRSGRPVGSSGYHAADAQHRRLEVGGTWVAPPWQRTPINTEAKLLMLGHAFETLGCLRVEFKTDSLNTKSRTALTRIGAVEEGTFRNHMVMPDGRIRHSVYFSITAEEWPAVRERLEQFLAR